MKLIYLYIKYTTDTESYKALGKKERKKKKQEKKVLLLLFNLVAIRGFFCEYFLCTQHAGLIRIPFVSFSLPHLSLLFFNANISFT